MAVINREKSVWGGFPRDASIGKPPTLPRSLPEGDTVSFETLKLREATLYSAYQEAHKRWEAHGGNEDKYLLLRNVAYQHWRKVFIALDEAEGAR